MYSLLVVIVNARHSIRERASKVRVLTVTAGARWHVRVPPIPAPHWIRAPRSLARSPAYIYIYIVVSIHSNFEQFWMGRPTVEGGNSATKAASSIDFNCKIVNLDGVVCCWGENRQLCLFFVCKRIHGQIFVGNWVVGWRFKVLSEFFIQ